MTDLDDDSLSTGLRRRLIAAVAAVSVIATVVALLHGPVVTMALTGDSYQWIQHAHLAAHRPALLAADLDTFYRPSTTWTLVIDRLVWGGFDARGYRTTSLVLHGLVALALAITGRRLGLGWIAAATVALVWVTSPFTDESAFVVAYRFQPLLLMAWLVLIAVWPRDGTSWSGGRVAVAALAVLAAAAAKETWVVTPVLVAVLEFDRRRSLRSAVMPIVVVGSAVILYVILYFVAFPTGKSYHEFGSHILAKIPQQLAAFLYLKEPMPFALTLTWTGVLAMAAVVAVGIACVRWRVPGAWTAMCLLVLPTIPTLAVPYLPQRYLAIPYAGFLLLLALWVGAAGDRLPRWRSVIRCGALAIAALVSVAGASIVRADLEDYRKMAAAHAVLLAEAAEVAGVVADAGPVAVVRDEHAQLLPEILKSPSGLPKLAFIRNWDPYGLIDAPALFEWVLADEGTRVEHVADWTASCAGVPGVVLVHRDGGFVELGTTRDVANEAQRWSSMGRGVQVIRTVTLN